jgi:pimeloyl-ACP methyl ester carboxylesterase
LDTESRSDADLGVVLIHGSMFGAWLWDRVVPYLSYPSIAVDLPGRGNHPAKPSDVRLRDGVDSVVGDIETRGFKRVVLVGHSLGGVVALGAADVLGPTAIGLMFISSVVPRDGRSWVDELPFVNRAILNGVLRLQRKGARAPERAFRTSSGSDVDDDTMRTMILPRLVPEAPRLFLDRVMWGRARSVPRSYLRLTQDREIAPDLQDRVIAHLDPVDVISIPSGHLPMITRPTEVADAINRMVDNLRAIT